jgi:hypothetical protein
LFCKTKVHHIRWEIDIRWSVFFQIQFSTPFFFRKKILLTIQAFVQNSKQIYFTETILTLYNIHCYMASNQ